MDDKEKDMSMGEGRLSLKQIMKKQEKALKKQKLQSKILKIHNNNHPNKVKETKTKETTSHNKKIDALCIGFLLLKISK